MVELFNFSVVDADATTKRVVRRMPLDSNLLEPVRTSKSELILGCYFSSSAFKY
jgi:hypothetical protein